MDKEKSRALKKKESSIRKDKRLLEIEINYLKSIFKNNHDVMQYLVLIKDRLELQILKKEITRVYGITRKNFANYRREAYEINKKPRVVIPKFKFHYENLILDFE
jgi:hypothetical protein